MRLSKEVRSYLVEKELSLAKRCHKAKCKANWLCCPQVCDCRGRNLNAYTAIMWEASRCIHRVLSTCCCPTCRSNKKEAHAVLYALAQAARHNDDLQLELITVRSVIRSNRV